MSIDVKALRALLDKATPGPWRPWPTRVSHPIASVRDDDGDEANIWTDGDVFRGTKQDDRALIVAAVNALPDLLAIAEAVRELAPILKPLASGDYVVRSYAAVAMTDDNRAAARRVLAILEGK